MYLLIVIIADYTKTAFHAPDSLAGLVVGIFVVGSLIGRFITGRYVNHFGPKKILIFGLLFLVITNYYILFQVRYGFNFTRLING